jgi:hypothetical protein
MLNRSDACEPDARPVAGGGGVQIEFTEMTISRGIIRESERVTQQPAKGLIVSVAGHGGIAIRRDAFRLYAFVVVKNRVASDK